MTQDLLQAVLSFTQASLHHICLEGFLVVWLLWLLLRKSYNPKEEQDLTEKEKEDLIAEWVPEPLVPDVPPDQPVLHPRIIDGKVGKYVNLDGQKCLNLATHNYLGFMGHERIEEKAIQSLRKYGVGSCGPRAFYGTVDVHLELELRLAKFLGVEESILYSYGFCTISSAIPAYAKQGDVIFVDDGVNFSIQQGLQASRSTIKFFRHNDTDDLERLLLEQEIEDKETPKKAKVTRRFLVVEGIYFNSGDLCPLPRLLELKQKFRVRMFVEESLSFAVLGEHGRGISEHFGIPIQEIDLISASLETCMGTIGGFCAGTSFIIERQSLSGLGYCFSASQPPLLATAAITALDILEENPSMLHQLRKNCIDMHQSLSRLTKLTVVGYEESPAQHLRLTKSLGSRERDSAALKSIVEKAQKQGLALTNAAYLEKEDKCLPPPSIRVTVSCLLTPEDLESVVTTLERCSLSVV